MSLLDDLITVVMLGSMLAMCHRWFSRPRREHTACDVIAHAVFNVFLVIGDTAAITDIYMLPPLALFLAAAAWMLFVSQPNRRPEPQHGVIREHNHRPGRDRNRQRSRTGSVPVA